jgi:hypothetical protein
MKIYQKVVVSMLLMASGCSYADPGISAYVVNYSQFQLRMNQPWQVIAGTQSAVLTDNSDIPVANRTEVVNINGKPPARMQASYDVFTMDGRWLSKCTLGYSENPGETVHATTHPSCSGNLVKVSTDQYYDRHGGSRLIFTISTG